MHKAWVCESRYLVVGRFLCPRWTNTMTSNTARLSNARMHSPCSCIRPIFNIICSICYSMAYHCPSVSFSASSNSASSTNPPTIQSTHVSPLIIYSYRFIDGVICTKETQITGEKKKSSPGCLLKQFASFAWKTELVIHRLLLVMHTSIRISFTIKFRIPDSVQFLYLSLPFSRKQSIILMKLVINPNYSHTRKWFAFAAHSTKWKQ